MPEFVLPLGYKVKAFGKLSPFVQGYIEAAFFTDATPDHEDMEDVCFADMSSETIEKAQADCVWFEEQNEENLSAAYDCENYSALQAGRDFWFTRNGHGVGFADRDQLPEMIRNKLRRAARTWRELSLIKGDDGKLYFE